MQEVASVYCGRWVTLLLLFLLLSAANAKVALADAPIKVVTITIANDTCLVDDTRVPCANVVTHLRDVLKSPPTTQFHIRPDKSASYEATAKVMEQFQKSEYKLKMGYVNVGEDSNK